MQNLLKKRFFFKMIQFLLIYFVDIIASVISSTQIACEYNMCVQHVIQGFYT